MCASQDLTRLRFGLLTCVLLLTFSLKATAAAPVVYVANNGIDAASCGTQAHPCRSITQAMANAAAGSIILVGPGIYGDINGDGKFDLPGEEKPQSTIINLPPGNVPVEPSCVVCILKPLHLVSRYGAESTIIDAGGASYNVVEIIAQNVTFGDVGRGFTVMHAGLGPPAFNGGDGVYLIAGPARVSGNIATANQEAGFDLVPGGESIFGSPEHYSLAGNVVAAGNRAIGNGVGFRLGSVAAGAVQLSDATAIGNEAAGVRILGTAPHSLTHSNVSSNGNGVYIGGGQFEVTHNLIAANRGYGVLFFDKDEILRGSNRVMLNDIVGNGVGVSIDRTTVGITLNQNNIYGNGTDGSNCGLAIEENGVNATNNYWGAPSGPGSDPADHWGQQPHCDGTIPDGSGQVVATPFAKTPFVIN
jgi:hypothetical protein